MNLVTDGERIFSTSKKQWSRDTNRQNVTEEVIAVALEYMRLRCENTNIDNLTWLTEHGRFTYTAINDKEVEPWID